MKDDIHFPKTALASISFALLLFILLFSQWGFPFTTDSFICISTAQQVRAFHGLVFTNFFVIPPQPDYVPVILEPPGYALLIALVSLMGTDEYTASILIPRLCCLFIPVLFFQIFRRIMPVSLALVSVFVAVFSFSLINTSLMAWTDVPYLFFCLISLLMIFRMIEQEGKTGPFFIFLAGIIGGYAFLIRYVGLVIFASAAVGGLLGVIFRIISIKNFIRIFCFYVLGVSLVALPYVIRNKMLFGTIQPYLIGHSYKPFAENIGDYVRGLSEMVFASPMFDYAIVGILLGMVLVLIVHARGWMRRDNKSFIYGAILVCYFVFYSIFLIAYKTISFGNEDIGERYLIQVEWLFTAGIVCGIGWLFKKIHSQRPFHSQAITGILLMSFVLIQIFPAIDYYIFHKNVKRMVRALKQYTLLIQEIPDYYILISNVADITHYLSGRSVRLLSAYTPADLKKIMGETNKFAVVLVKNQSFYNPSLGYHPFWNYPEGYRRVYSNSQIEILLPQGDPA